MAKKDSFYFENFVTAADYCCKATCYLEACLKDFDVKTFSL